MLEIPIKSKAYPKILKEILLLTEHAPLMWEKGSISIRHVLKTFQKFLIVSSICANTLCETLLKLTDQFRSLINY